MNNNLLMFNVEVEQTKMKLKDQIKTIRYILDNIESKLNNNEHLYESDGLQGNAINIDVYLSKIASYENVINKISK